MGGSSSILASIDAQSVTPDVVANQLVGISEEYAGYREQILASNIDGSEIGKLSEEGVVEYLRSIGITNGIHQSKIRDEIMRWKKMMMHNDHSINCDADYHPSTTTIDTTETMTKIKFNSVLSEMKLKTVVRTAAEGSCIHRATDNRSDRQHSSASSSSSLTTVSSSSSSSTTASSSSSSSSSVSVVVAGQRPPYRSLRPIVDPYIEAVIVDAIRNVCSSDIYAYTYDGDGRKQAWESLVAHFLQQSLVDHELSCDQLFLGSLLGRGKFAAVYQGRLDSNNDCVHTVAVKVFQYKATIQVVSSGDLQFTPFAMVDMRIPIATDCSRSQQQSTYPPVKCVEEFQRELSALYLLKGHANIVDVFGYTLQPMMTVVLELGSEANLYYCLQDEEWQVKASLKHRCSLLLDVTRGLQHMHRHHVLHRDIKSHNILLVPSTLFNADEVVDGRRSMLSLAAIAAVGAGFTAKITDFGSSLLLSSADACVLNDPVGTMGYTAPEVYLTEGYSFPADVFSTSIVMWEVMTNQPRKVINPLACADMEELLNRIRSNVRPSFDASYEDNGLTSQQSDLLQNIHTTIQCCWSTDPKNRLDSDSLHSRCSLHTRDLEHALLL